MDSEYLVTQAFLLPSLIFLRSLIWSCTTLTVTRFLLNIRRLASEQRNREAMQDSPPNSPFPMVTTEICGERDSSLSIHERTLVYSEAQ